MLYEKPKPTWKIGRKITVHSFNYSFTIEHKRLGEIVHVDHLLRDGCTGTPTAEELQMERDTKDITISSIIIQQGNLNSIAWKEKQEKDEELKTVKQ